MIKELLGKTFLFFIISITNIFFQISPVFASSETVAIVFDQSNASYRFAAGEMKKDIEASHNFNVILADIKFFSAVTAQNRIILTTRGTNECNSFLSQSGVSPLPSSVSQGYSVRKKSYKTYTDWYIIGFDKIGAMYGGLDFGQSLQFNGFNGLRDLDKKPYVSNRGIKFNIPLDARTPSYSDNSDIAQSNIANMWDINFWYRFLDNMAKDKFNMLSLWSLAPFPSLVIVPEYPKASLNDVKKTTAQLSDFKSLTGTKMSNPEVLNNLETIKTITIEEKVKFWKEVMQYGSDRGIDFYIFTWNIFVYGTENSGYDFTSSVTDSKTKDYFRKATKALVTSYPLLKGIGITAGENMNADAIDKEIYLYDTYGKGINDALALDTNRTFRLIHRAHQSNVKTMKSIFSGLNSRCSLEFSYKYSQAHVYSSVKPDYIIKDNFIKNTDSSSYFFTLRDDDWYYLRGGSDPEFTRAFIKNMPTEKFSGFYLGPDGYTWGRETISINPNFNNQLVYEKRWYSFHIWGMLSYDPKTPESYFVNELKARFPEINTKNLYDAWAKASQVVPIINRFHNVGCQLDYQWYPEICSGQTGFHTIDKFIGTGPQSGEGLMSIPAYTDLLLNKTAIAGITPIQVASDLQNISEEIISLTKGITTKDAELLQTIEDIKAMASLGKYYSKKIIGATNKCISDKITDSKKKLYYRKEAIKNLQAASDCWRNYAGIVTKSYKPQYLTRMQRVVDVTAIQTDVDEDILLAERGNEAATTTIVIAYRIGVPALDLAAAALDSSLKKLKLLTVYRDISKRIGKEDITIISENSGNLVDTTIKKEGFRITNSNGAVVVNSNDVTGAMYGAFDVAEQIVLQGGLKGIEPKIINPYLSFRAIKYNLPWSPYWQNQVTSDNYKTCRDTLYWKQFLNMMALNRFNVLTLWNLHPFTYMIRPAGFPKACSFTDNELADWKQFWHSLFRMAKERGIETYLVNWNIFVSKGFKANYDSLATSEDQSINGKVYTSEQIKQYTRECITQTFNEYSDLTGIGTSLGERMKGMSGKEIENWISSVYFEAIKQVSRPVRFIHRAPFDQADIMLLRNAVDSSTLSKPVFVELKFNHSHGMSAPLLWRSHGTSTANIVNHNSPLWVPEPVSFKMTWMIRNEDILFLRWGEPSFIRKHIANNSKNYVAGYYVGSETYIPADDIFHIKNSDHISWKYAFERQWLYYSTWGRLLYDPATPDAAFEAAFDMRYDGKHGAQLLKAYQLSSRMPLRFATLFEGTWDKSLYSEGFATFSFIDVNEMIKFKPLDHNLLNISDYVDSFINKNTLNDSISTPAQMSDSLEVDGNCALALVNNIQATGTLACEIADIKTLANLSLYFSAKIRGGIELELYRKGQGLDHKTAAISYLKRAELYWEDVVKITSSHYQKSSLVHFNGNSWFWSDYSTKVKNDITIALEE